MTFINSRTRGVAPMMMGNLSDKDSNHHASSDESVEKVTMENCTAWKSGSARSFSLNLVMTQAKATEEGRVKLTESVSAVDAFCHIGADCIAQTYLNGGPPKSSPKGRGDFTTCAIGEH